MQEYAGVMLIMFRLHSFVLLYVFDRTLYDTRATCLPPLCQVIKTLVAQMFAFIKPFARHIKHDLYNLSHEVLNISLIYANKDIEVIE